jgi:major membrane immunogen (membrane-anchored lipoprotein)
MQDGYYTAEEKEFYHGWKEFVTIYVSNGQIVTVEYNAKNPAGFIKSWDMDYMRNMGSGSGTYPNEYTRTYAAELLAAQDVDSIDLITGATNSYNTFVPLARAAIEQAKKGDKTVIIVDVVLDEAP